MKIQYNSQSYGMISHDITSHCNARCKFCLNDWSQISSSNMTLELFRKSRVLLHFCAPQKFHFSCLYEPTLNPNFFEMLDLIPFQYRNHAFFTTNLLRKMSDDELLHLCNANVSHFNVSLETYQKDCYENLTGVKNSYFYDNLHRLASIAKQTGTNHKIHIITMILRSNYDELMDLIRRVHDEIDPGRHELRTPYITSPIENVLKEELLTRQELDVAYHQMKSLGYSHLYLDVTRDLDVLSNHLKSKNERVAQEQQKRHTDTIHQVDVDSLGVEIMDLPRQSSIPEEIRKFLYKVRINSDGTGYFMDTDEIFDLNAIDDPLMFFSQQLLHLEHAEAQQYVVSSSLPYDIVEYQSDSISSNLEDLIVTDGEILSLRGWFLDEHHVFGKQKRVIFLFDPNYQEGVLLSTEPVLYSGIPGTSGNPVPYGFFSKVPINFLEPKTAYILFCGFMEGTTLHLRCTDSLPPVHELVRPARIF